MNIRHTYAISTTDCITRLRCILIKSSKLRKNIQQLFHTVSDNIHRILSTSDKYAYTIIKKIIVK